MFTRLMFTRLNTPITAGYGQTGPMHVAITGATGLIGSSLATALEAAGHTTLKIGRSVSGPGTLRWDPANGDLDADGLEGIDAMVHLAGEGIAENKWTDEQKRKILESRTVGTELVASTLAGMAEPPSVLVSGSAIGFYGDRGQTELDEQSERGQGFLADLVVAWEAATKPAADAGIRVAFARTGIVMSADGGALGTMLPFFRLGIGGRVGNGKQQMSWISMYDMVQGLIHLLENELAGPVNFTAPNPVSNNEFTKALGATLSRPTLLPTPTPALYLMLGKELARDLLFSSAKILPTVLVDSGFVFDHPTIEQALASELL